MITGGVRSGKSRFAEELATQMAAEVKGSVLYAATAKAWDEEMRQRIASHQLRRPQDWGLVEIQAGLDEVIPAAQEYQLVILDCLSNWISNQLMSIPEEQIRNPQLHQCLLTTVQMCVQAFAEDERTYIVVTNEVGLGGVALTPLGRWFADLLGEANQQLAGRAEKVYWVMAGIPRRMKG